MLEGSEDARRCVRLIEVSQGARESRGCEKVLEVSEDSQRVRDVRGCVTGC